MKSYLLIVLLFLGCFCSAQNILVNQENAVIFSYDMNNLSKLTFTSENMTLHFEDNSTINFPIEMLNSLSYVFPSTASINELISKIEIYNLLLFPNPAKENWICSFDYTGACQIELTVLNSEGNIVGNQLVNYAGEHIVASIDNSTFASGVYFVRIRVGEFLITKKVIKL